MKEQKYFISYAAYSEDSSSYDIFNNILTVTTIPICDSLIDEIQSNLLKDLNDLEIHKYYATQIISMNKL
jgi:hypothetical protein